MFLKFWRVRVVVERWQGRSEMLLSKLRGTIQHIAIYIYIIVIYEIYIYIFVGSNFRDLI